MKEALVARHIFKPILVIEDNARGIKRRDDPSYPCRLEAYVSWPDFHGAALTIMHRGPRHLVVRARSRRAIMRYIEQAKLRETDLLQEMEVTGPQGEIERYPKRNR